MSRWRSQLDGYREFEGYSGSELPHVDRVGQWLEDHRPAQCHIGIVHGDYQFANVMFSNTEPKLAAMSTGSSAASAIRCWISCGCSRRGTSPAIRPVTAAAAVRSGIGCRVART